MHKAKTASGMTIRRIAQVAFLAAAIALPAVAHAAKPTTCNPKRKNCNLVQPSPTNSAPTISGTPAGSVTTGQNYSFTPSASDADGNPLTFSIENRPGWANFSSSTGRLSGTPTSAAVGEYIEIRIGVSDGQTTASLTPFAITVNQANRPPTISGDPPMAAREGQAYAFVPNASDADDDVLAFSVVNRPAWATFNSSTGQLSGTPGIGSVGSYPDVTIRVSDGTAIVSLPAFAIDVQQSSMGSATLSWQPPTTRVDGSPLTNLAGYRIRYGTSPGSYANAVTVPGSLTSAVVSNLPPGTYYFVTTAFDSLGTESGYSDVVSRTIQ